MHMAQVVNSSVVLDLPVEVLAAVLQHVKQPDRLRCCAMVSKKWRQAANMTNTIFLTADTQQRFDSLSAWLNSNQHASRIHSIQVVCKTPAHEYNNSRYVFRVLFSALKQVRSLQLLHCRLQFVSPATNGTSSLAATARTMAAVSTASTLPGFNPLRALTALSRLELINTSFDLSELSRCTGLQHLQLRAVNYVAAQAGVDLLSQLASALPQLTQLTHLELEHTICKQDMMANFLASLRHLQQLKELQLSLTPFDQAADVTHIPTSLSSLRLECSPPQHFCMMPQLQQMTQLQCLLLIHPKCLDPMLIYNLTQLTCLCVIDCPFEDPESVAGLLRAVQQLKQLQRLDLAGCLADEPYDDELYAALTASSQLTSLNITGCKITQDALPYHFPDTRTLPALISIAIHPNMLNSVSFFDRAVACCPALQELVIEDDENNTDAVPLQGLSALQGLSSLTTLTLHGVEFSDDELRVIAANSQLKRLTLYAPPHACASVTPARIMQLTQLTGLTRLYMSACMAENDFYVALVAADGVPDVCLQLQQAIAKCN